MFSLQTVAKSDLLCNYHCRLSPQTPRCFAPSRQAPWAGIMTVLTNLRPVASTMRKESTPICLRIPHRTLMWRLRPPREYIDHATTQEGQGQPSSSADPDVLHLVLFRREAWPKPYREGLLSP
jgi:hypothetical protein